MKPCLSLPLFFQRVSQQLSFCFTHYIPFTPVFLSSLPLMSIISHFPCLNICLHREQMVFLFQLKRQERLIPRFYHWLDAKIHQRECREWITAQRMGEKIGELVWRIQILPVSFWGCHGYAWDNGHHIPIVWNVLYNMLYTF